MAIRILLITPSLKAGGTERAVSELANYLVQIPENNVGVLQFGSKGDFYSLDQEVLRFVPKNQGNGKFKNFLRKISIFPFIRKKVIEFAPDVILSFGAMYNSYVMLSLIGLPKRIYLSDRSNPNRNNVFNFRKDKDERHDGLIHYLLKRFLYPKASGIIVQTKMAKNIAISKATKNVIHIPNAIRNLEEIEFNIPEDNGDKYILNVGRFVETKHQMELLEIFSRIRKSGWKLVFAGDGPLLEKAKQLSIDLNLSKQVLFLGNVKDIDGLYPKCDILAFLSTSEGFPNALGEAMRAGLACISFNCVAGPSDLIDHRKNGILVSNHDYKSFENELAQLMVEVHVQRELGDNAKEKVKEFSYENVMKKYIELIEG